MLSMTGFGIAKISLPESELVIQVKSVNSRFLDIKINLPRDYQFFEKDVRELIKKNLSRGNVEVYCSKRNSAKKSKTEIKVDKELAKKWLTGFNKLKKELNLKDEKPLLLDVIKSVPVLSLHEDKSVSASEKKQFLKTMKDAVTACLAERKREGAALKTSIKAQLQVLFKETQSIEKNREKANKEIAQRILDKFKKINSDLSLDTARIAQETSLLVEKSDINEELVRLQEHISECKKLLNKTGRVGKKLDFYSQEMLREVNTIGSKSQVKQLTHSVVNCKSVIEQIREQVQNVE